MSLTPYNSPMSANRAHKLISGLNLNAGDRVLDAGCGAAEFLINLLKATGCMGVGLDIDQNVLNLGSQRSGDLIQSGRLDLKTTDFRNSELPNEVFDVAICLGSSHAFAEGEDAYPVTLERLRQSVKPNAKVLIGECYWRKDPDPEYLKILGEPVGIYRTFDENLICATSMGYSIIDADHATLQEWDTFEQDHLQRAEDSMRDASADGDVKDKLKAHREWYEGYEKWGRETLGFGFYLLQRSS